MKPSSDIRPINKFFAVRTVATLLFGALAATSPAIAAPPATASDEKTTWRTDLPAALAEAAKQDKTVLLRFTANWCGPCRVMDARVWPDQSVQAELADKFIIVKRDIDEEQSIAIAQKYGVRGVPTILLLDSNGKEIARSGFMSSPETVRFLSGSGGSERK